MSSAWQPAFRLRQDHPEEICPIPAKDVEEQQITHSHPASVYGVGSILRRYAGLPEAFPIQVSVEHFINYKRDRVVQWDIDAGFRTFLAVDQARAGLYRSAGMPRTQPVGFALHYALRMHEKIHGRLTAPKKRRGTLVFPHKSEPLANDRHFDHHRILRWMKALPEEFHPIYVCFYWKDYLRGDAVPYADAGYPILSCGYWMDQDFLLRFVDMCGQFRYVCANSFASSFPLSVLCGCHFMYMDTGGHVEHRTAGESTVHATDPTRDTVYGKEALPITTYPPVDTHRGSQVALARSMSGFRHVRSRWWMWWVLRREARHAASLRGGGLDFTNRTLEWKELHPWACEGIERDGWMHSQASVLVPANPTPTMLVMEMELPEWAGRERQRLLVRVPGRSAARISLLRWRSLLRVPLPQQRGDAQVSFEFEEPFSLPGEIRTACARMLKFTIEPDLRPHPSVELERLKTV